MADTDKPTTALTVRKPAALAPTAYDQQSVSDGYALATYLAKSGMLGKDIKSPEQALTVMIAGRELGFTAMQSLRAIYIAEGRVTLSADAMVALVLRSPECEYLTLVESTAEQCTYKTKRRGQDEVTMAVDESDAKKAGWGATHGKYPAIMKRHRCASNICRSVYPDVVLGMFTPDDAEESSGGMVPEPVQSLPREEPRVVLDAEWSAEPAHDSATGEVKDETAETPQQKAIRLLGTCRDDAGLVAAREACQAVWPKMADAPADVQTLWKEAKARVEAIKKEGAKS